MESQSVIYIGTMCCGDDNVPNIFGGQFKLYITIITNCDDYLPMSEADILAEEQFQHKEAQSIEEMFGKINPNDFRKSSRPEPTTGNINQLKLSQRTGLKLFDMVESILNDMDVIVLYCILGTHVYPIAISKIMNFTGMHNCVDNLEQGLAYHIDNHKMPDDHRMTLILLKTMLPHFTVHSGSSYTKNSESWFPQTS